MREPSEWQFVEPRHSRYKGRDFYGEHADEMAELNYLRDWKRWAEWRIKQQHGALVEALESAGYRVSANMPKDLP